MPLNFNEIDCNVIMSLLLINGEILMIKYAKFIHSQAGVDSKKMKIKEEEPVNHETNSNDNQ